MVALFLILLFLEGITCLDPCAYEPANVQIHGYNVSVNNKTFIAQGIGYSPVPPDTDLSTYPNGDYFTSLYSDLWTRDLKLMRDMNATLIRIWSWDFMNDHHDFLDSLISDPERPLYILLPFMMSLDIYKDLTNSSTRRQALTDFRAFLKYNDHPAIFGIMIGNELDRVYGDNLNDLFSLMNSMIRIKQSLGLTVPITAPLSSTNFENILNAYYPFLNVDFWSIQVYTVPDMDDVINAYINASSQDPKPLLITEFGASSIDFETQKLNETLQGDLLQDMWNLMETYSVQQGGPVFGGSVMEWCDEWWKGDVSDVEHVGCPNYDVTKQSLCGTSISNVTFLFEEWLGITEQLKPIDGISSWEYCIRPRYAYYALSSEWCTNETVCNLNATYNSTDSPIRCGYVRMKNPFAYIGIPIGLLIILWIYIEIRHRASKQRQRLQMKESLPGRAQDQIQHQQKMEKTIKAIANINETQLNQSFDPNRQSWKIGKSNNVVKLELQDLTLRTNVLLKEIQKHLAIVRGVFDQSKKTPVNQHTERFLIALEHFQQLQEIQQKRLEKLQAEIAKQAQPSLAASAEEIFDAPRPQLENLADRQQSLAKPIALVEECGELMLRQPISNQLVFDKVGELQAQLRAMERQELMQLDSNIAKLQKTLSHQSEEIAKQDDLDILKQISGDMARQELELKVYQNRLVQYIDRADPEERERLMRDLRSGNAPQKRKDLNHVKMVLHVLVQLLFRKYTRPVTEKDVQRLNANLKDFKDELQSNPASQAFDGQVINRLRGMLDSMPVDASQWHFSVAAMRVENLIWDKILSSKSSVTGNRDENSIDHVGDLNLLKTNTECVYHRYLEGFFMWRKRKTINLKKRRDEVSRVWIDMLEDLVLWNVVSQCAGTLNHSPEKVCEVFHYTTMYVSDNENVAPEGLVEKLLATFAIYCKEIASHEVNFDDVNHEACIPEVDDSGTEKPMEAQGLVGNREDRNRFDFFAKKYCVVHKTVHTTPLSHEENICRYTPTEFPQRGGIFGAFVSFGWLIRMNIWIMAVAWYCLQHERKWTCADDLLKYLAIVDAGLCLLIAIVRIHVVGKIKYFHILWALYFLAWIAVIVVYLFFGNFVPILTQQFPIPFLYNLFDFYLDIPSIYIIVSSFVILALELRLLFLKSPFAIQGRENNERLERWVWIGFGLGSPVIMGALLVPQYSVTSPSTLSDVVNYDIQLITLIVGVRVSGTTVLAFVLALVVGALFGRFLAIRKLRGLNLNEVEHQKRKEKIYAEIFYLVGNVIFWLSVLVLYWVLLFHLLLPSASGISFDTCICNSEFSDLAMYEMDVCSMRVTVICYTAVALTWAGIFLVSFVGANACFQVVLLGAGAFIATHKRIGNVSSWSDVGKHFKRITSKCFPMVSTALKQDENKLAFWNFFVDSMFKEHLISETEKKNLCYYPSGVPNFSIPPQNKEARRRIIKFFWSLEAMLRQENDIVVKEEHRKRYQVRTMPSWTIVVPCATETTLFGQQELLRPKSATPRISWIEYLAATYPDEWENFAKMGMRSGDTAGKVLLDQFLNTPVYDPKFGDKGIVAEGTCSFEEVEKICFWASCRGQTLVRTIRGLFNYRDGLIKLAELEEGIENADEETKKQIKRDVAEMVHRKFQIIIALQIYNPEKLTDDWTAARNTAFLRMLKRLSSMEMHNGFDLVFNCSDDIHSGMIRIPDGPFDPSVAFMNQYKIKRPCALVIGEPKAENQSHALAFALNEVLQVNDMNMYNTLENAFKIPFLLNAFFGVPDDFLSPSSVIPPFRIVGFPEHCYTRNLSMVGMLMASAEFCFVTITQRVLAALRVRAHYGHPDFIDGYWARTRGGVSKASHLVNTNEDIFAGYEMIGRGERIAYVEYVEEEKGRESGFNEAFTFEAKLAQGAAQQIRSRELYHLNNRLPLFNRLSLFFGSIGFYVTSMFMSISIDFYMYAIIFFAISGVTYHQLGLLHAVIAVPWMIQIGFVQALPLLVEQMIQQGFWEGFILFITQLPFGLVFFVFHLRTKAYFFEQGLFSGKGGYKGTGRGFGLDRMSLTEIYKCYFDSHFHNAIVLFASVLLYWFISTETSFSYFLRVASILLVIFSWLMAPIIFNPYATADALHTDLKTMTDWASAEFTVNSLNDPGLHIANLEAKENKRKDELKKWIDARGSWQAWFVKVITDEWEEEDKHFQHPLNIFKSLLQKTVLLAWRYLPWFLLGQYYFRTQSVYYFISFIFTGIFVSTIDERYTNQHEHFALWKASVLIIAPSMIVFYFYGDVSFGELFLSVVLCIMICFVLVDWSLGIYNLRLKTKAKWQIDARDLLLGRYRVPRYLVQLQKLWPFAALVLLGSVNLITVVFCGGLTTLLFNGRVADMWNRAYLYQKQL